MANLALANEHKRALRDISTLAARDMAGLLRRVDGEPPDAWASQIRGTAPRIIKAYGTVAGQLSAAYYNRERSNAVGSRSSVRGYAAKAGLARDVAISEPITKELGYWIGQAVTENFQRTQIITPALQLVEKGVFDHSRAVISRATDEDKAGAGLERVVSGNACEFCQYMALLTLRGSDGDFHKGCACILAPVFQGQKREPQPWEGEFNREYEAAQESLRSAGQPMTTRNITGAIRGLRSGELEE